MENEVLHKRLKIFLSIAVILLGLLAGETVDRLAIGMLAWKYTGISAWAEYSRNADLKNGLFIYPFEAIVSLILLIASSVTLPRLNGAGKEVAPQVYLATAFSVTGLILTFFAAPAMFSVKNMADTTLLQQAFDRFYFWSTFRGIAQILSFLLAVWAIAKAFRLKL